MQTHFGFWAKLPDVCSILAPMAEVTDAAFRRVVAKYGKPDVLYTEFVSAEGLMSRGRERLLHDLQFHESERPIVAQIFDNDPDVLARATEFICTLGFDGVEVNMGCPDKAVMKQGAGAALIEDAPRAARIMKAMKDAAGAIPVSVKTRLGTGRDVLEEWLPRLLEAEPAAITIHARTAKEMSLVPARWERVARAVEIAKGSGIRIIGNGDVASLEDGYAKARAAGAGGFMVGRVAIGNPFFFRRRSRNPDARSGFSGRSDIALKEKLEAMCMHARLCEELMPWKPFVHVRKHLSKYASGERDIKALRVELMTANNAADVAAAAEHFLATAKEE
ncbi:MAG: tRNA-dihydrouridine synthase [Candidatus Harrisonbacteria bacterium]|nr:tRNA-dihydrouridine synthase [Candidatus Harrisonbacteria bacterium]